MSFDLIIKNGTVILENEARVVDIAVKGGKIAAIGQDLGDAKEVMDASGLVVSPGMVDAHTHISEPGRSHWEGYETGTRAAARWYHHHDQCRSTSCQQRLTALQLN